MTTTPLRGLILSTDEFKSAVQLTRDIYLTHAKRLFANFHDNEGVESMARYVLMDRLLADDNLCEMLAGRVAQLQHGTRAEPTSNS